MSHLIFMLFAVFDHLSPIWANNLPCSPQTECLIGSKLKSSVSSLTILVKGQGSITSSGFSCETQCTQEYVQGSTITLTATPTPGHLFSEWEGDCQGVTDETTISLEGNQTCIAQFIPQTCQPTIYSPSQTKLYIPLLTVEMYAPLSDVPNQDDYALCTGKGGEQLTLKYQIKDNTFLASKQEIVCANQFIKLSDQSSCPLYSAKRRTLEVPNLQVTSEVFLHEGKKLSPGKCYQASLIQGIKPPYGTNRPATMVDSRLFTLIHIEEQSLCK